MRSPDLLSTARGDAANQMIGEAKRPLSVKAGHWLMELTVGPYDASRPRVVAFMSVIRQSPDHMETWTLADDEALAIRTAVVLGTVATNQQHSLFWTEYARRISPLLAPPATNPLTPFFERVERMADAASWPSAARETARRVWESARTIVGVPIQKPTAGVAADGGISLSWNTDDEYLEFEFSPEGTWDVFYRDKGMSGIAAVLSVEDLGADDTLPTEVVDRLRGFSKPSE
ncbi:MAG: hypothetical protein AAF845_13470 [Bacteroidota bacterium]